MALVALGFALGTDRIWEDYLITYRSSKNLVEGNGLVFHPGEKLHTFTSPLGVLLPAFCHWVSGRSSDAVTMWCFRVLSIAALAAAAAVAFSVLDRLRWPGWAAGLLALWLVTEAKSVDFSINGMETGFLLLFVALTVRAHFMPGLERRWMHLGLAWAGLMWTRPDGCVYVAALAGGSMAFAVCGGEKVGRMELLRMFLKAGALCTIVYLPWLVWAWWYYGTPVPHTITAKNGTMPPRSVLEILGRWTGSWAPVKLNFAVTDGLFTPSGWPAGGWPMWLILTSRVMAFVGGLCWVVKSLPPVVRALSLASGVMLVYLGYFTGTSTAAWYMPGPGWLVLLAVAGLASAMQGRRQVWLAVALGALWCVRGAWTTVELARLSKVEQVYVEEGNRKVIGEWLKANAQPGDTMFMECLGYLGYYSGLKTLDYPGLSSREVVDAVKEVGTQWHALIRKLKPVWVVLRPYEAARTVEADSALLVKDYEEVKVFDVSPRVERMPVHGQGLLSFDSTFIIFKRRSEP
ncbi:MAG: hypothetical protein JNJ83_01395 [Verrucomicrobiaceae bacterium]|nr:hypothetical protein [Verrucomicrobiaceae bacterium]